MTCAYWNRFSVAARKSTLCYLTENWLCSFHSFSIVKFTSLVRLFLTLTLARTFLSINCAFCNSWQRFMYEEFPFEFNKQVIYSFCFSSIHFVLALLISWTSSFYFNVFNWKRVHKWICKPIQQKTSVRVSILTVFYGNIWNTFLCKKICNFVT